MPVTARVVGDERMATRRVFAACDMAAERHCAAALDCAHHFQLVEAHMAAVGLTPSGTVIAEDIRDLQSWSNHNRRRYDAGGFSVSGFARRLLRGAVSGFARLGRGALRRTSGLSIFAINPVATRV